MSRRNRRLGIPRSAGGRTARLRTGLAYCAACIGAAAAALAFSLLVLSALVLAIDATGAGGHVMTREPLHVAVEDGAVLFYLTQLVGVTFFHHTAGLRVAPLLGLALIGIAIGASTMGVTRMIGGSARNRMRVAMLVAIPFALLSGFGAILLNIRVTGPGVGRDTLVAPDTIEAFLLPLVWGLLFATTGGMLGVFGARWRRESSRLLRGWATASRASICGLVLALAVTFLVVIVAGSVVLGPSFGLSSLFGGNIGHVAVTVGGVLLALPTLVIITFLASFGVSFDWHLETLTRTHGTASIFGGTLPATGTNPGRVPFPG